MSLINYSYMTGKEPQVFDIHTTTTIILGEKGHRTAFK